MKFIFLFLLAAAFKNENMTLEYLIEKYIEKTGYGMDMWSKEENAVMTTVAEIIEESKVNKISSNTLLAPVYRYDIRCDKCGRFINSKEFKKNGGASECFVPDSEVSTEEIGYRCKKCTKEHGMVKAFQSVRHDLTSWIH